MKLTVEQPVTEVVVNLDPEDTTTWDPLCLVPVDGVYEVWVREDYKMGNSSVVKVRGLTTQNLLSFAHQVIKYTSDQITKGEQPPCPIKPA